MKRRQLLQWLPGSSVAGVAAAQAATPGVDTPPLPGSQRPLVVPPIAQGRMANGLSMLVVPRRSSPLVTVALHVRAGREHDPAALAGLASLTASLLTKGARRGTRAVDAATLARQAEALGSALDVSSGWRTVSLSMTVTTPKLPAALALLSDVLRTPLMQSDELERLRAQALDSLKVTLANPGDVSGLAARRLFWGDSVYGASATPASLQRLTLEALVQHHKRLFRPDLALLVFAGDIDPDAARLLADRQLGDWAAAAAAPGSVGRSASQPQAERALVAMPGSGQSSVVIAAPFAALGDADRRVAEVAAALLAGGYSSRLNQEVRIKRGLSYGVGGGGESHAGGGMFTASAQTQHATAREVAALMHDELMRVTREEASEAELTARKANLVGSFARQLDTTAGLAGQAASQYFQGRAMAELARYVDDVMSVSPAQVRSCAHRLWAAQPPRLVIAGDLQPQGGELLVPIAALDLEQPLLTRP